MRLSTKSRYGLRALFDIAYHSENLPTQIQDIAERQQLSPRYLEQIFQKLKKAGILASKRGPRGGYCLAKPLSKITVNAVIMATEGDLLLVDCSPDNRRRKGNECGFDGCCVTQTVWSEISEKLQELTKSITLQMLCERGETMGVKRVNRRSS